VCSIDRESSKPGKSSHAAIRDAPRLDRAVCSQSDAESSSDDTSDDDDGNDVATENNESGSVVEAAGASADLSVS